MPTGMAIKAPSAENNHVPIALHHWLQNKNQLQTRIMACSLIFPKQKERKSLKERRSEDWDRNSLGDCAVFQFL